MKGRVYGIDRVRRGTDGTGYVTLVGMYGCPLKCKYCLNENSHDGKTTVAEYTSQELVERLNQDEIYFRMSGGGVVFGGGEPLLQAEFIREVAELIQGKYQVRVETSLNVLAKKMMPLLDCVDEWIIDIKDMNEEVYSKYTSVNNEKVLFNLRALLVHVPPEKILIRVPEIPGYEELQDRGASKLMLRDMGFTRFDCFRYKVNEQDILTPEEPGMYAGGLRPPVKITQSEHFQLEPVWHLTEGASQSEKEAIEEFFNPDYPGSSVYRFPSGYYNWDGTITNLDTKRTLPFIKDPMWSMEKYQQEWEKIMEQTQIKLIKGDITKITNVDVIVNAANKSLLGGGGVDGAIHRVAGPELLEECKTLNGCETGEAKITNAYKLPCKKIIHTAGPRWMGGNHNEDELLVSCYWNSLKLAVDYGLRSIAFPSISTGIYHYPLEQAAKLAVLTVKTFLEQHENSFDLVEWVLFDDTTFQAYEEKLKEAGIIKTGKE